MYITVNDSFYHTALCDVWIRTNISMDLHSIGRVRVLDLQSDMHSSQCGS